MEIRTFEIQRPILIHHKTFHDNRGLHFQYVTSNGHFLSCTSGKLFKMKKVQAVSHGMIVMLE